MALPEPGPQEGQKSGEQTDKDFDPSAEALIDEIDDERTLEEEEALGGSNSAAVQEELDDLKKESEMPIEQLLAYYERMRNQGGDQNEEEDEDDEEDLDDEDCEDEDDDDDVDEDSDDDDEAKPSDISKGTKRAHEAASSSQPSAKRSSTERPSSKSSDQNRSKKSDSSQQSTSSAQCSSSSKDDSVVKSSNASDNNLADNSRVDPCEPSEKGETSIEAPVLDGADSDGSDKPKTSLTSYILGQNPSTLFDTLLGYDIDESDGDDYSYTDDDDADDEREWRRSIQIGPEFQAEVPEGLCEYDDLPPYQNEDKLIWKCDSNKLSQEQIIEYLKQSTSIPQKKDVCLSPSSVPKISNDNMRLYRERMRELEIYYTTGQDQHENNQIHPPERSSDVYMNQSRKKVRIDHELEQENTVDGIGCQQSMSIVERVGDSAREENSDSTSQDPKQHEQQPSTEEYFLNEEQLLYLLLQCNHNPEEALRRRRLDPFKYYFNEPMTLWSEEECLGFEHGLRIYGKDFRQICLNKIPTRTNAEVVTFYYLWKKSERHDAYTMQYKLDRKRCLSHPGTTDYMDKFIEDNESALNGSSTSSPSSGSQAAASTPTPTESTLCISSAGGDTTNNDSGLLSAPTSASQQQNPQQQYQQTEPRQVCYLNIQQSANRMPSTNTLQPHASQEYNNLLCAPVDHDNGSET